MWWSGSTTPRLHATDPPLARRYPTTIRRRSLSRSRQSCRSRCSCEGRRIRGSQRSRRLRGQWQLLWSLSLSVGFHSSQCKLSFLLDSSLVYCVACHINREYKQFRGFCYKNNTRNEEFVEKFNEHMFNVHVHVQNYTYELCLLYV